MRLKRWSEAERFHRAALEVEPNHVGAHISFGTMLARNVSSLSRLPRRRMIKYSQFTFRIPLTDYFSSHLAHTEQSIFRG